MLQETEYNRMKRRLEELGYSEDEMEILFYGWPDMEETEEESQETQE